MAGQYVLAGDVGGTKTLLALYRSQEGRLEPLREARYVSASYAGLPDMLADFLGGGATPAPSAACFGVAGPVVEGRCRATNLPWLLDQIELSGALAGAPVTLLNDLEAAAHGLLRLPDATFHTLNAGVAGAGNIAVIAAGTGLGEALVCRDGAEHRIMAGEGGHCDFAPADALQDGLLAFLRRRCGSHVSYERILSGSGLYAIYQYLLAGGGKSNPDLKRALQSDDPAAAIARYGLEEDDATCRQALGLFARIYGQEAGNLALKCLARGGVLLAGGIAPKLLPMLADGAFMAGFCDKGRFSGLMREMPVRVCLEPRVALLGAAAVAAASPA